MPRLVLRVVVVLALVGAGWLAGTTHARDGQPRFFTLTIDAPAGETSVHCSNCRLFSWSDGAADVTRLYTMTCAGPAPCRKTIGGQMDGPMVIAGW
jgi:hypothetical protein